MEVVGQRVGYIGGHASGEIPGILGTTGHRCRYSELVPGVKASNVDLVPGGSLHFVVAVGAVEMPPGAKVVVEANYAKVIIPWNDHISAKGQHVQMITSTKA